MKWTTRLIRHKGEKRIAVEFEVSAYNLKAIREFDGARWSESKQFWHLPDNPQNRKVFDLEPSSHDIESFPELIQLGRFERWLKSKRYSPRTVKTYTDALRPFLFHFRTKAVNEITNEDVILFNNEQILKKDLSTSYQNQIVNAIKLFFLTVDDRKIEIEKIHRPKREKTLPNVLSKEEVKLILTAHRNLKHRAMLSVIYSCGLRRSELLSLKMADINSTRNLIFIRQAKGKKDRVVPLSPKILEMLREYYSYYKPKVWLFEGNMPGRQYDERSLHEVLKLAVLKSGITKPVSLHWLRHSYATHLLESGTDLRYIQEILGHNSSRTTEIYTHVSTTGIQQVKSPFDDL